MNILTKISRKGTKRKRVSYKNPYNGGLKKFNSTEGLKDETFMAFQMAFLHRNSKSHVSREYLLGFLILWY